MFKATFSTICIAASFLFSCIATDLNAQAGVSISPSRLYYNGSPNGLKAQKIIVTNPSDKPLELGVSIADWNYDSLGNNVLYDAGKLPISCANALKILPGSFFTLKPNEQKELSVQFNNAIKRNANATVQTAMIYITQLNAGQATKTNGASIKVTVRVGVKVYFTNNPDEATALDVINFKDASTSSANEKELELTIQNSGKIWGDGKVKWELLNTSTGNKTYLDEFEFYSLPGDKRIIRTKLPSNLAKGKYTATSIVTYGKNKDIKVAELEFVL